MNKLNNEIKLVMENYITHPNFDNKYKKVVSDLLKKCSVLEEGNLLDHLLKQIEEKRKLCELNNSLKGVFENVDIEKILNNYKNKTLKKLTINNLNVDDEFNVYQISSLTNNFNTDVGMYTNVEQTCVVIKCTLHKQGYKVSGRGMYHNELLSNGNLKYYCESDKNSLEFKKTKPNKLLKQSLNMISPVKTHVFVNGRKGELYKYLGIYYPINFFKDEGGYYFILTPLLDENEIVLNRYSDLIDELESSYNNENDSGRSEEIRYLAEVMMRNTGVQKTFKKNLMAAQKKCALCNVKYPPLLIASHIKPLRAIAKSNDNKQIKYKEATDNKNGLLLCNIHDALFDKGYISFDDNGQLLISSEVPGDIKMKYLGMSNINNQLFNKEFMKYHRKNVFRG